MTKEEFGYFIELIMNDYNAAKTPNLMIQYLYAKFKKKFTIEEINDAHKKYYKNLEDIVK